MIPTPRDPLRQSSHLRGSTRTPVVAALSAAAGIGLGFAMFHHGSQPPSVQPPALALSEATTQVLAGLRRPVEMRFYSVLDPNAAPELRNFSARVNQLLDAYQADSGKIAVNVVSNASANAARSEGITGVDLDKGEGSYLGLVLVSADKKQVLPQLSPQWEPALECDISRALAGLAQGQKSATGVSITETNNVSAVELQKQFPDVASLTLEQGTRILREASVKEFAAAVTDMQAQVRDAESRVNQSRASGSAQDQDAALRQLQAVQAANTQKLKDIAALSQARIDALKALKGQAP
ncbi:MAG TPA: Gldg family protein [Verrucomicrobiae bacterium]|nr:Gldg family protein [Verrucomicrobiae bacterium]